MGVYAALGINFSFLITLTNDLINFIHHRGMYGHNKLLSHLHLCVRSIIIQYGDGLLTPYFLVSSD